MLFRLTNALVLLQQSINNKLYKYLDVFYIVYLDNILIYSKTIEEYIEYIKKVL